MGDESVGIGATRRRERVFLDVGAHDGATANTVLSGPFEFDRVISVEPDLDMVETLSARFADAIAEGRYVVAPVGLADRSGDAVLYGDNSGGGASIHATKFAKDAREERRITLLDWSDFVERYQLCDADLYVKINCEGAEVAIVDSIVAGDVSNIRSLVVDFDIIKTPFGAWAKWRAIQKLRAADVPFLLSERVFVKRSGRPYIENWLQSDPVFHDPPRPRAAPSRFQLARIKYLELVSAVGLRVDAFKRRR